MSGKIALLIDTENVSYKDLPSILEEVPRHGKLTLRAVYGDWEKPASQKWRELAEQHNFKLRHHPTTTKTKNGSDMKLIIDAMEVLRYTPIDIFCIVTNDADYVPLCHKLHETHKTVIGMGYQLGASEAFIRACDKFIFLGRGESPAPPAVALKTPVILSQKPAGDSAALRKLLLDAFARTPHDTYQWTTLTTLASSIHRLQPGFSPKHYGHGNLTKLLGSMPDFIEVSLNGADTKVRLKNHTAPVSTKHQELRSLLLSAFAISEYDSNGWLSLSALGSSLRRIHPTFNPGHYGAGTLKKLLSKAPDVAEIQRKNGADYARLKIQPTPVEAEENLNES